MLVTEEPSSAATRVAFLCLATLAVVNLSVLVSVDKMGVFVRLFASATTFCFAFLRLALDVDGLFYVSAAIAGAACVANAIVMWPECFLVSITILISSCSIII